MNAVRIALAAAIITAAGIVAAYIAAAAFFLLNKAMPAGIAIDTWLRCWDAYAGDPVQHRRLLLAAASALLVVLGLPLLALAATARTGPSLHGDARWARSAEIRKAGLL